jgi:hypothetical protein
MTMAKVSSFRCPVTAQADNFHSLSDNAKEKRTTEVQRAQRSSQWPLCLCGKSREPDE